MSYEKDCGDMNPKAGICKREIPSEPISEQVRCIDELGNIANGLANRIFVGLFGRTDEGTCEDARMPECLEEELKKHRWDLKQTVGVLEEICARLGC